MINHRNHYITPQNENQAPKINFKGLVTKDSKLPTRILLNTHKSC